MIEVKKSIETGQPLGLYNILKQLQYVSAGVQGEVYFVDAGKGSDSNNGKSWESAYGTIAFACTQSRAKICSGGFSGTRNTIFCRGIFTETITDFGEKNDLIGVGSADAQPRARLIGTQVVVGSVGNGVRFFNWEFYPDSTSPIMTWDDAYGIVFYNCVFTNLEADNTTYALDFGGTSIQEIVIENCVFRTDTANDPFETAAIYLNSTTAYGFTIKNNLIEGDIGILISSNTVYRGWIDNNVIKALTLCIDDDSDDCIVSNNMCVTDGNNGTLNDVMDCNVARAVNNKITAATGGMKNYPPLAA